MMRVERAFEKYFFKPLEASVDAVVDCVMFVADLIVDTIDTVLDLGILGIKRLLKGRTLIDESPTVYTLGGGDCYKNVENDEKE